ncbi:MAG: DUF502 domain-containing protein [Candidatus Omnitrophica bacterium]|nr:DUF502 domain-containing protein [Candidatus Omnitrophota bacterium]
MMRVFSRNFITGLLVILPAFLTYTILRIIFSWFHGLIIGPFDGLLAPFVTPGLSTVLAKAAIVIGFFLAIALIGFGTRILLIQRFFVMGENLVRRVPIVGKIYNTMKGIADAFKGQKKGVFNRAVLLEWPVKGQYVIGFVTSEGKGEVQEKTPEYVINVFVPTTPNPTTGFLFLADRSTVINLEMSVEDAMKLVISGGVVGPEVGKISRNG